MSEQPNTPVRPAGEMASDPPPSPPGSGPERRPLSRRPVNPFDSLRTLLGLLMFLSGGGVLVGLAVGQDDSAGGVLAVGIAAVVFTLGVIGMVLCSIGDELLLLSERAWLRRQAQQQAEHRREAQYWADRHKGREHGTQQRARHEALERVFRRQRAREVRAWELRRFGRGLAAVPGDVNDFLRNLAGRENKILFQFVRAVWLIVLLAGLAAGGYLLFR